MERRQNARRNCRQMIKLVAGGKEHSGIITNASKQGLYIQTSLPFKAGEMVEVIFESGTRRYRTRAQIRWSKNVPLRYHSLAKRGIGVLTLETTEIST
ncbi:MAG: PilZ domain-containing protein [Acidobacteria bacterium]|nr:PilZ domain-containing protein [Acidobacteriota bacterium]